VALRQADERIYQGGAMNRIMAGAALVASMAAAPCWAQNVKVTPLGSHDGELCARDRATLFEDPSGVRILYDAGHSVTGGNDPRLGDVHVVLLTHAHGDHLGDRRIPKTNAGSCESPDTVSAEPNSTTAEIAAAKNAALIMVSDLGAFVARKVQTITGKPVAACPEKAGELALPFSAPCVATAHLGGTRIVKAAGASKGVEITLVHAAHANNLPRGLLTDPEKTNLAADNLSLSAGPPIGYVVHFTNGLRAYLSGDSGLHADMRSVVQEYHKANLAVINLGPSAVNAHAAAYAMNDMVKPAAVIASHPNEAVTSEGKLRPQSRTALFASLVKGRPVFLARSGRTMEFDGDAKCLAGCQ
jgi:L-ascorbate metabolism protein UlaG (beta-lactamase superfamily)